MRAELAAWYCASIALNTPPVTSRNATQFSTPNSTQPVLTKHDTATREPGSIGAPRPQWPGEGPGGYTDSYATKTRQMPLGFSRFAHSRDATGTQHTQLHAQQMQLVPEARKRNQRDHHATRLKRNQR